MQEEWDNVLRLLAAFHDSSPAPPQRDFATAMAALAAEEPGAEVCGNATKKLVKGRNLVFECTFPLVHQPGSSPWSVAIFD